MPEYHPERDDLDYPDFDDSEQCDTCGGAGCNQVTGELCVDCGGTGFAIEHEYDGPEDDRDQPGGSLCPGCDGTGERDPLSGAKCYICGGDGLV